MMTNDQYEVLIRRMKMLSKAQTSFIKSHLSKKLDGARILVERAAKCLDSSSGSQASSQALEIKKALLALKLNELTVDVAAKEVELKQELTMLRNATHGNISSLFNEFGDFDDKDKDINSVFADFAPSPPPKATGASTSASTAQGFGETPSSDFSSSDFSATIFPPAAPVSQESSADVAALLKEIAALKLQITSAASAPAPAPVSAAVSGMISADAAKADTENAVALANKKSEELRTKLESSWEARLASEKDSQDKALAAKNKEILSLSNQIADLLETHKGGSDILSGALKNMESQLSAVKGEKNAAEAEVARLSKELTARAEELKAALSATQAQAEKVAQTSALLESANKDKSAAAQLAAQKLAEATSRVETLTAEHKAALLKTTETLRSELTKQFNADAAERTKSAVDTAVAAAKEEAEAEKEEIMEAMAQEVEELEALKDTEIARLNANIERLNGSVEGGKAELEKSRTRIATIDAQRAAAEEKLRLQQNESSKLRTNMNRLQNVCKVLQTEYKRLTSDAKQQLNDMKVALKNECSSSIIGSLKRVVQEVNFHKEKFNKEYALRKQLHNIIQELKGNIRVYVRSRPPSRRELEELGEDCVCVSYQGPGEITVFNEKNREKAWEFDETFDWNSKQEDVYRDVAALVTSVMDGFNVCIFAYGQTGSGKTHTMAGTPLDRGVNWRALDELFRISKERSAVIRDAISLSILEVYNEDILDLLGRGGEKLEIRQGEFGNHVPGLTQCRVNSLKDVEELFARAESNRSTATTNMNEHSSRSHMSLSISVVSENLATGVVSRGKLNLVDLAGSERLNRSGAAGQALKEAQNINKSLSALGDVIAARASKAAHIPFRNSTLTHLLQDSLSKDSKTLMICCISPTIDSAEETYCSLNFASRVRSVELGKASKNAPVAGAKGSK
jgi:kinesin family protein C2/C3